MLKRTFIAQVFTFSDQLKKEIELIRTNIKGVNVKWVETHNLHLTLAFLGDTPAEKIEKVREMLEEILKNYKEYPIRFTKAGVFKSLSNPQVLWIGIESENTLQNLYRDIQDHADDIGFVKDNRPFKPHLTIGRIKSLSPENNLKEIIMNQGDGINEISLANAVVFYESTLTREGPVYKPLQIYKLD